MMGKSSLMRFGCQLAQKSLSVQSQVPRSAIAPRSSFIFRAFSEDSGKKGDDEKETLSSEETEELFAEDNEEDVDVPIMATQPPSMTNTIPLTVEDEAYVKSFDSETYTEEVFEIFNPEDEPIDDRTRIEMPGGESLLKMASGFPGGYNRNNFEYLEEGMSILPEDLNWMTPKDHDRLKKQTEKPAAHFREADQDPMELALNPDLLRVFLSPTGRIQPRRFTGLSAKEQRKLNRAIRVSRVLGLLPYTSRYPKPSPEQMDIIVDEIISRSNKYDN